MGFDFFFGFLDGFGDASFVEGFEDVVHGVDVESLHGVLVEGGGEDDVRDFELALDELFEDAEAVEAGHLHVEEEQIGGMLFNEIDGFEAIFALGLEIDLGEGFQEEGQLFASGLFVVTMMVLMGMDCGQVEYRRRAAGMAIERGRERDGLSDNSYQISVIRFQEAKRRKKI